MEFKDFTAGKDDEGRRFDRLLRRFLPQAALSNLYKSIRTGLFKLNHKKVSAETKVKSGDIISIAAFLLEAPKENKKQNEKNITESDFFSDRMNDRIIFKNQHLLIFNKPYDMNVHGENSLEQKIKALYKTEINNTSLSFAPGPLHRLDKKTSGLIAFSWSLEGSKWFSENIKNHTIKKTYCTIFEGIIHSQTEWLDQIFNGKTQAENSGFHTVKVINTESAANSLKQKSKQAVTIVTPIKTGIFEGKTVTFAKVQIKTGRKHQIRAQGAFHGHPLLGDTAYGGTKINSVKRDFFLHASTLEFPENPVNLPAKIECVLPEEFNEILNAIKKI